MTYFRAAAFTKTYRAITPPGQERVEKSLRKLVTALETRTFPPGLGLKKLRLGLWEIRAGLLDRIVFRRAGDTVEFLIVGTHDEIKRFLKHRS